jgi:hypothetical protein
MTSRPLDILERNMSRWGISDEQRLQVPGGDKADKYAILIVPRGTELSARYISYTKSERNLTADEIRSKESRNSGARRHGEVHFSLCDDQREKMQTFTLKWREGRDLACVRSLAQKGCFICFDLPEQSGRSISWLESGEVFPSGLVIIRLFVDGVEDMPALGGRTCIDFKLSENRRGAEMAQVLEWLDKHLR